DRRLSGEGDARNVDYRWQAGVVLRKQLGIGNAEVLVVTSHEIGRNLVTREREHEFIYNPGAKTTGQTDREHVAWHSRIGSCDVRKRLIEEQSTELTSIRQVASVASSQPVHRREIVVDANGLLARVLNVRRCSRKAICRAGQICRRDVRQRNQV